MTEHFSSDQLIYFVVILGLVGTGYLALSQIYRAYHRAFTQKAHAELSGLYIFWNTDRLFLLNLLALCLIPIIVYLSTHSSFHLALSIVLLAFLPGMLYRHLRKRRLAAFELSLPDSLSQLAGSMKAGATFIGSLETMVDETRGPIHQEFNVFLQELRLGVSTENAMENLTARMPSENLRLMTAATLIAKDLGGNLAEVYGRLADTLRQKMSMEAKIAALTSQGRMQGWVVGLLPFGIMLILQQMEPESMQYLTNGLLGWIFLSFVIVMELFGLLMIRKIVSIEV
jgi:tight adherence protein B